MKIREFQVAPNLPEALRPLREIAMNVWFAWHWDAIQLFLKLDPGLFERCYQNPVRMLGMVQQDVLDKAARDSGYVAEVRRVHEAFRADMESPAWYQKAHGKEKDVQIAYFSCEYGLSECFPVYGGGLGILSGDHLKSASDLGVPLCGVGLLYQKGYFQQYLNLDGWQMERYPENDWYRMPVEMVRGGDGEPLRIEIEVAADRVQARVWRAQVGRVPLFLLDTNVPENPPQLREISHHLYGGGREMRIRQEVLLGVGGIRALEAMGIRPTVYHMNEGHSAFLAVERVRMLMDGQGMSFNEAREAVFASSAFTTHTPVPAGNEHFEHDLVRKYLEPIARRFGIAWKDFYALGQEEAHQSPTFCMTVFALRFAAFANGVADLHAATSRKMWQKLWPNLPTHEVPIQNVSNGVHPGTWISHDLDEVMRAKAGVSPRDAADQPGTWEAIDRLADEDIWQVRETRREKLVLFARKRLQKQLKEQGADVTVLRRAAAALDPKALTIGFARRFATYKRAGLILADPDRLAKILGDSARPVQVLIAGKAHPADQGGKEIIRSIVHLENDPRFRGRIVFLEDYDMIVARYLIQGCDIWLNTPKRPMEASGTSGMKAVLNGGLHLSTLDGWWADAFDADHGWAIGGGEEFAKDEERDQVESEALYNILEQEVVPIFYDRNGRGLSKRWIEIVRASMKRFGPVYNTHRMVREYVDRAYLPAHRAHRRLFSDGGAPAKKLAAWRARVTEAWPEVAIDSVRGPAPGERRSGEAIEVTARVRLGPLSPDEVSVEVFCGALNGAGEIETGEIVPMEHAGAEDAVALFRAVLPCRVSGRHGFSVRILPRHADLANRLTPLLLTWEA